MRVRVLSCPHTLSTTPSTKPFRPIYSKAALATKVVGAASPVFQMNTRGGISKCVQHLTSSSAASGRLPMLLGAATDDQHICDSRKLAMVCYMHAGAVRLAQGTAQDAHGQKLVFHHRRKLSSARSSFTKAINLLCIDLTCRRDTGGRRGRPGLSAAYGAGLHHSPLKRSTRDSAGGARRGL